MSPLERVYKPSSVHAEALDDHSSRRRIATPLMLPTRTSPTSNRFQSRNSEWGPYLALLQVGFALPVYVTVTAVRSYRTFSP